MKKLNSILLLLCWSHSVFASVHYTLVGKTRSGKPCLNTCTNGYCAVGYRLNTEACVVDEISGVPTYYTSLFKGDKSTCRSNCDKFGYPYEWCFTTENYDWDYCSSKLRNPEHENGYDVYGYGCFERCENNTVGHFECMTSAGVTKICARPATVPVPTSTNIFSTRRTKRGLDKLFSPTLCSDVCRTRVIDGRDGYTQDLINSVYNGPLNVENITNPAAPFTFAATTNATNANGDTVYLPLIVQATLRQIPIPVQRHSSDITGAARTNVHHMYNGLLDKIDVGHLIAFQNGGTTDLFNYVGQTAALNRGAWKVMENMINDWINYDRGTVKITVVVLYNGTIPKEFVVKLKFFNGDGTLHSDCLDMIFKNN